MTDVSQSNTKNVTFACSLPPALVAKIDALAAAAGMTRTKWTAAFLSELVPQIESAAPRSGLEVRFGTGAVAAARVSAEVEHAHQERNGAPAARPPLKPNRGTPFEQAGGR